jgi:two-component system, sporulation sensor kinase A
MLLTEKYDFDFKQLVAHSLNAIFLLRKDQIIYANKAACELVGASSVHEVLDTEFQKYLHKDFHVICKQRLKRVREKLEIAELMEQKLIKLNGKKIDIEVMAAPYIEKGEVLAQVTIRDITLRKKAERQLHHAEKLSAIGEVAAGVAHEVKNPLTAVKGFLQILQKEDDHPYLGIMYRELKKALSTITQLLQVARPELDDEPLVSINLCGELDTLLNLFKEQLYRVNIVKRFSDHDHHILGKKNLLLKAFFNLIKNAFEAIEDKGSITVEHFLRENSIHIIISDTGVGIPEDKLNNLGTPFYSTKLAGTGMGLTQVYNTINAHNGSIDVESEVGKGTTFSIQLPVQ